MASAQPTGHGWRGASRPRRNLGGVLQWPTMTGPAGHAASARVQPLALMLEHPSEASYTSTVQQLWDMNYQKDLASLQLCYGILVESLFPDRLRGGHQGRFLQQRLLAHTSAASGFCRVAHALRVHRRMPRWVGRFLRIAPSAVRYEISQPRSNFEVFVRAIIDETFEHPIESVLYCLHSHASQYLGKANFNRARGRPGYASRVFEHHQALVCKDTRDARLPRYTLLKGSLGSVSMIPFHGVRAGVPGICSGRAPHQVYQA